MPCNALCFHDVELALRAQPEKRGTKAQTNLIGNTSIAAIMSAWRLYENSPMFALAYSFFQADTHHRLPSNLFTPMLFEYLF